MSGLPDDEDFGFVPPELGAAFGSSGLPRSCQNAREQMRDYADGDLEPADHKVLESHVHGCRACAVALARVEFETLRLRRAFSDSWAAVTPPPGFARRTLARLLIESPELALSPEAHAEILALDLDPALTLLGDNGLAVTARDIPGINDVGPMSGPEPILADGIVAYVGQPIAAVAAPELARAYTVRAEMANLVANFQYYIMFEVLASCWSQFNAAVKASVDLDGIVAAHEDYVRKCVHFAAAAHTPRS
jgi:anti-sigma factor RsiW